MKKLIHGLILVVFGLGCWFAWAVLTLAPHVRRSNPALPGFTTLCISLRPFVLALPILAAVYCIWVWFRKQEKVPSWVGFFAVTIAVLTIILPPSMVAAYLPLLDAINHLADH